MCYLLYCYKDLIDLDYKLSQLNVSNEELEAILFGFELRILLLFYVSHKSLINNTLNI